MKLKAWALEYPETYEEHPWGETVIKVHNKVFLFLGSGSSFRFSVKLPESGPAVLELPFAGPTGYGLGKSGWVTISVIRGKQRPTVAMVQEWLGESFRAVAPKKLSATLDA